MLESSFYNCKINKKLGAGKKKSSGTKFSLGN